MAIDNTCHYGKNNTIQSNSALVRVLTWHEH